MARVTGPLMSMDASGTIASAIVFSRWKGLSYVRRHAIPMNPRLPKQQAVRATLRFLSRAWASLTAPTQAKWALVAETMHQSGFNRFVGENQSRLAHFLPILQDPTVTVPAGGSVAPTVIVTGGIGNALIDITLVPTGPDWGWCVFGALGAPPVPSPANIIAMVDVSILQVVHSPIPAGNWHYIVRGFGGVYPFWGTDSSDAYDTVT